MDYFELPMGFGMALARNPQALNTYSAMTQAQKQAILDKINQDEGQIQQIINGLNHSKLG